MRTTRRARIADIAAIGHELAEEHLRLAAGRQGQTGPELALDVTLEQILSGFNRRGNPQYDTQYDGPSAA
jgi:hypothetical protein